jgi:DNA-binding SARP family transcriptional activator
MMADLAQPAHVPHDPYELHLMGDLQLLCGATDVTLPPRAQRIVALLALVGPTTRPQLSSALWPDTPDGRARADLRTCLWRLSRRAPGLVSSHDAQVQLGATVTCDVWGLQRHARAAVRLGPSATPSAADLAELTVAGSLLPGWDDIWVTVERERLRQLRLLALEALSERMSREGRTHLALAAARAAADSEPLRESSHRAVMRALVAAGDIGAARHHLRIETRRALTSAGVPASPLLQALATELRRLQPGSASV